MTAEGVFAEFPIPTPGSEPSRIAAGPDGALWFTEFSGNKIGRITTAGVITEFAIPTPGSNPTGITAGPDGNLWFTEQEGHKIGRITTDGVITEFPVPPLGPFPSFCLGIVAGPDGNLWFSEAFTGRVGRITTDGVITLFPVEPLCCAWLGEIAAGADGNLWFAEQWDNKIGRITPSGSLSYFGLGSGGFGSGADDTAYGIAAGPDGALWFTHTIGKIGRITTDGIVSEFEVPTAGASPQIITAGPDGNIWFTEIGANKIGRLSIGSPGPQVCTASSIGLCLNAERFRVQVSWRVPSQGTSGVGTAVPLTGDTGYFWFFSSNNVELVVKVVDGRAFNGHFWVFYGALSDVEYTITVTDTATGAAKTYTNPQGQLGSVADTAAFAETGPLRVAKGAARYSKLIPSAPQQGITEFSLPAPNSGPGQITVGPDGALWFTEGLINKIGRITTDGVITEFPIPGNDPGAAGITVGPDGALWFTENRANKIGRMTTDGVITDFAIPTPNSGPGAIAAGPDGNLWFLEFDGDKIGRISPTGVVAEFSLPTRPSRSWAIAPGPDGNLWFTEQRTDRIGRITPAGVLTEFQLSPASTPNGIVTGPDGALWFTELNGEKIGRITTDGIVTEFSLPPGRRGPAGITAGPDGALWFTEEFANKIGRITMSLAISEFDIPTVNALPRFITAGSDGNIWFTELRGNKVGRMTVDQPGPQACTVGPTTLCLNAERFRVQVSWRVPSQGTSGVGTAVPLTGDTGYFWFFSSNNVELVVKVVDGRAFNGHFWVFYGALSDVEYTITVTDTATGAAKTYTNPQGQLASVADTAAF